MVMKGAIRRSRANSEYYTMKSDNGHKLSSTNSTKRDKLLIPNKREVNMEIIEAKLNQNGVPVGKALVKHRGKYYIVSESTKMGLETLIFEADYNGTITNWSEVGGSRGVTLVEVLENFASELF